MCVTKVTNIGDNKITPGSVRRLAAFVAADTCANRVTHARDTRRTAMSTSAETGTPTTDVVTKKATGDDAAKASDVVTKEAAAVEKKPVALNWTNGLYMINSTPLIEHQLAIFWAKFTPDGKRIVSADPDNTISVYRLSDGKVLKSMTGHSKGCCSIDVIRL